MEQFLALLWGDLMMRLLLKTGDPPNAAEIERRADAATGAFLKLYAASSG